MRIYRDLAEEHPKAYQLDVARTLNNLGNVQHDFGEQEAARASYEEAARLYDADPMARHGARLWERQGTWANLGSVFRQKSDRPGWPDYSCARDALRKAVACAEDFRGRLHDRALRTTMQAQMLRPYELLVLTCVDLWDVGQDFPVLAEAVHVAEQSRARNLIERLAEKDIAPRNAPQEQFADFLRLRGELEGAKLALELESRRPRSRRPQRCVG